MSQKNDLDLFATLTSRRAMKRAARSMGAGGDGLLPGWVSWIVIGLMVLVLVLMFES